MLRIKCFFVLLAATFQATSHDFLTQILVVSDTIKVSPDSTYHVIETFHLTPAQLGLSYKRDLIKQEIKRVVASQSQQRYVNPESVYCDEWDIVFNTCGVFDHFNEARSIAIDMCAAVALDYAELYEDGLIPQFIGPATFTSGGAAAADHHDNYHFSQGLSFNCVEVISNLATE